jgi:serine/tyrosine/threonine adenylyltransferase
MSVESPPLIGLERSDFLELEGLYERWQGAPVSAPELLVLNERLAAELGLDAEPLKTPDGVAVLAGAVTPAGASPVAQAYAGHQFGSLSPRLGDGRALLLGELVDIAGRRRDLHLKGSGRTPFARGGDGLAAVGPMLREYLLGEAMHALGIPTTRALSVVATGDQVVRETLLPGAVLARVAASHLRVGTFQYAAMLDDPTLVRRLADHAIIRHHPHAAKAANPYLALFEAVCSTQASTVAQWMLAGFVHGVMNTDNVTISGETIDYGPCAFMEAHDPAAVYSSIDHGGRYAYGNQPQIMQWNLARLAEAMLPLIDEHTERAVELATEVLVDFPDRYGAAWADGMLAKLGLPRSNAADEGEQGDAVDEGDEGDENDVQATLVADLLALLREHRVDHTNGFRSLSSVLRGDADRARSLFSDPEAFDDWAHRWQRALDVSSRDATEIAASMDRVNPVYIPRNHLVEEALAAGTAGDLAPFHRLLDVVTRPFEERPGLERYAEPAPTDAGPYRTFCGT